MGVAKYNQEFECSFIGNIRGSIYGDLLSKLEDKKQVASIPYDVSYPVHTAWDIGFSDSTSIIFFQQLGHAIHLIDYYENNNQAFPHYAQVLKEKDYVYENHYAPHDIEVTDFVSGKTRREVAYQMGIRFRVAPKIPLEDGIHSVKMILERCFINIDNCSKLINALRHYHRKYNDKDRVYKLSVNHDWSSHGADALRTLAVGLQEVKIFNNTSRQQVADNQFNVL
jgi:hypothetical protein